jgi:hypothetical protein
MICARTQSAARARNTGDRTRHSILRIRPRMTFIFGAAIALETEPVWGKTFAGRTPTVGFLADRASSIEQSLTTVGESGRRTPPDFADPEAACEPDGGSSDPGGEEAARPRSRLRPGATCRALGRTRRRDRRGRRLGTRDGQRITTGLLLVSQYSTVDALEFRVWASRLRWLVGGRRTFSHVCPIDGVGIRVFALPCVSLIRAWMHPPGPAPRAGSPSRWGPPVGGRIQWGRPALPVGSSGWALSRRARSGDVVRGALPRAHGLQRLRRVEWSVRSVNNRDRSSVLEPRGPSL